jgi:hypothetical protein
MNLRCLYCQTPFTLSRVEMLTAVVTMNEKNQSHYDAHCPRCRRANSISRQRMELFLPNWREAAKELESAPAAPASASQKTEPSPKAVKKTVVKTAATEKPSGAKRQRAGKSTAKAATAAKSTAKKTSTAKTTSKGTKSTKKK